MERGGALSRLAPPACGIKFDFAKLRLFSENAKFNSRIKNATSNEVAAGWGGINSPLPLQVQSYDFFMELQNLFSHKKMSPPKRTPPEQHFCHSSCVCKVTTFFWNCKIWFCIKKMEPVETDSVCVAFLPPKHKCKVTTFFLNQKIKIILLRNTDDFRRNSYKPIAPCPQNFNIERKEKDKNISFFRVFRCFLIFFYNFKQNFLQFWAQRPWNRFSDFFCGFDRLCHRKKETHVSASLQLLFLNS